MVSIHRGTASGGGTGGYLKTSAIKKSIERDCLGRGEIREKNNLCPPGCMRGYLGEFLGQKQVSARRKKKKGGRKVSTLMHLFLIARGGEPAKVDSVLS